MILGLQNDVYHIVASCLLAHIRCVQSISQTAPNCHRFTKYAAELLSQAYGIHMLAPEKLLVELLQIKLAEHITQR